MSLISPLLPMALVGLKQSADSVPPANAIISPLFNDAANKHQTDKPIEITFLQQIGVIALCELAGFIPSIDQQNSGYDAELDAVPNNTLSESTQKTMVYWLEQQSLSGAEPLWIEALNALIANHIPIPREVWPLLLDLGLKSPALVSNIKLLITPHAKWLISLNKAWQALIPVDNQSLLAANLSLEEVIKNDDWQLGTKEQRYVFFRNLRKHSPQVAIALLEKEADSIKSVEKVSLIELLQTQLSSADEAYLNSQLTHRSEQVRNASRNNLRRLPTSHYMQTAQSTLFARIKIGESKTSLFSKIKEKLTKASIDIDWPDDIYTLNMDFKKLNIDIEPKQAQAQGISLQEYVLQQLVASIPLTAWESFYNMDAEGVVGLGLTSIWSKGLIAGWQEQTLLSIESNTQAKWAATLLHNIKSPKANLSSQQNHAYLLVSCLPIQVRINYLWDFNNQPTGSNFFSMLSSIIAHLPHNFCFSMAQSRLLLQGLKSQTNVETLRYSFGDWPKIPLFLDIQSLAEDSQQILTLMQTSTNNGASQFITNTQLRLELATWVAQAKSELTHQ